MFESVLPPQANNQQNFNTHAPAATPVSKDHTVLPKSQTVQPTAQSDKANSDTYNVNSDEGRRAKVEQAAREYIANMYVVSDHSVTIFKDSTGQFITRLRNLKDGKISYYPEPDMLRMGAAAAGTAANMVKIKA